MSSGLRVQIGFVLFSSWASMYFSLTFFFLLFLPSLLSSSSSDPTSSILGFSLSSPVGTSSSFSPSSKSTSFSLCFSTYQEMIRMITLNPCQKWRDGHNKSNNSFLQQHYLCRSTYKESDWVADELRVLLNNLLDAFLLSIFWLVLLQMKNHLCATTERLTCKLKSSHI